MLTVEPDAHQVFAHTQIVRDGSLMLEATWSAANSKGAEPDATISQQGRLGDLNSVSSFAVGGRE